MDNFLINKLLHKRFAYVIAVFLYIFIFYMVFEHVFDLSKLVFQYNSTFDYGKYTKTACSNEFFEYETERFHVSQKKDDMKLTNTTNKKRYILLILVLAILMTLFISFTFTYVLYNTFFNKDWLYKLLDITPDAFEKGMKMKDNTVFQKVFAYMLHVLTLLYSPIKIISGLFYKLFVVGNNGSSFLTNILLFAIIVVIYLLVAGIVVIMPLYICLKMGFDIDISPFNSNYQVYVPYIVAFALILIIRLLFLYFKYSDVYIEKYNPITEYFSSNVQNMYTANNLGGYLGFFAIFATYIVMFYIVGNIINIYINSPSDDDSENTEDDGDESDTVSNINKRKSITNYYMSRTIGYGEYNKYQVSNVFVKNLSGVTFTMIIIIVVMCIMYYFIILSGGNDNVKRLMKYGILTPFAFLTIIILTASTTTEFNTLVNDYILNFPDTIYKQYIDILNRMFNNLIHNEYSQADGFQPQYVCKNVGNAIMISLFNELFYGVPKISRTGKDDSNGVPIDITPEFQYERTCEYMEPFNFTEDEAYNISYYINGKDLQKNIFYNYNKCSEVNTAVLRTLSSNLQIFDTNQLAEMMQKIQQAFYIKKPLVTKDPIQYIKLEIVAKNKETNIKVDNLRYKLKRKIHKCIYNVRNNLTSTDSSKSLITFKDDSYYENGSPVERNDIEVYNHNNKIDVELSNASTEEVSEEYDTIVDDIIEIYMDVIYYHLYTFTPFWIKLNINKSTQEISTDNDKYQELQDNFIKELSKGIVKSFDKIKEKMSSPLISGADKTLTSYIITNFNTVHTDRIYKKEQLLQIAESKPQDDNESDSKKKHMKIYDKAFNMFSSTYSQKIKPLIISLKTNDSTNIKFIMELKNAKTAIGKIREELSDYKYDESFKEDINSIFRNEDNKYMTLYDIFDVENDKKNNEFIDNTFHAFDKMMKLALILISDMESKHAMLLGNNIKREDKNKIESYGNNIDLYSNIIDSNNYAMNIDLVNYQTRIENTKNTTVGISAMNIDLSRNTLNDSCKVDKLIYLVCLNYIISIIMTNFIYNI